MVRITNAVLAEKIDNIYTALSNDIKPAIKANTEFRLKATGMMGVLGTVMGFIGAGLFWLLNKFWGGD